jgi:hypothetical protein
MDALEQEFIKLQKMLSSIHSSRKMSGIVLSPEEGRPAQ